MKCSLTSCRKVARRSVIMNGMSYCSVICARNDSKRLSKSIKLEETEEFFPQERGDLLGHTSKEGLPINLEKQTTQEILMKRKDTMPETKKKLTPKGLPDHDFDDNLIPTEKGIEKIELETREPQLVSSIERLSSFEGASYSTMSLIDNSAMHMHSLMKSISSSVRKRVDGDGHTYIEPALINAAANTTKQMASLLKLKLDFHKEINKKKGK